MNRAEEKQRHEAADHFLVGVDFILIADATRYPDDAAYREKLRIIAHNYANGVRDGTKGKMV